MAKTAAFGLAVLGGIITLLVGIWMAADMTSVASILPWISMFSSAGAALGVWGIIAGLIMIFGAWKMNNGSKNGATITLIFSILALITMQGFIIGPILGLIGSLLGWKTK